MAETSPRPAEAYDAWAPIYDRTFGALVAGARRHAMKLLDLQPGQRVLDLGVGTGAMMDAMPADVSVVGVDLSRSMLERAARRLDSAGRPARRHLVRADAQLPPFADRCFDHVLLTHVVSVVDDPPALMRAAARLVGPEGSVLIVNHFREPESPLSGVKKLINPLCMRIGWRSDLTLDDCLRGADLHVEAVEKRSPFDLWRVVRLRPIVATEPAKPPTRSSTRHAVAPGEPTATAAGDRHASRSVKPAVAMHIR